MATTTQINTLNRLHDRLCEYGMKNRLTREQRQRVDTMISHVLKARDADSDIADQEIVHAQAIVGR